jgi:hypothetical protein
VAAIALGSAAARLAANVDIPHGWTQPAFDLRAIERYLKETAAAAGGPRHLAPRQPDAWAPQSVTPSPATIA